MSALILKIIYDNIWRPSSLSELTTYLISLGLTHLGFGGLHIQHESLICYKKQSNIF